MQSNRLEYVHTDKWMEPPGGASPQYEAHDFARSSYGQIGSGDQHATDPLQGVEHHKQNIKDLRAKKKILEKELADYKKILKDPRAKKKFWKKSLLNVKKY